MQRRYSIWSVVLVIILQSAIFTLPSAVAQVPGILNYQGRVAVNGTNFDGTGQFKFALVDAGTNTSRQAMAVSFIAGDLVVSNTVTYGGAGYVTPPNVAYQGGGGAGATAYTLIGGGAVTSVVRASPGSGYTSPPTVVIDPPPVTMSYRTFWSNGTSSVSVPVTKGLYSVLLGDTNTPNMETAVPASVFTNTDVRLRVWFNGQQLSPDQRIASAGYALMAATVPADGISGKLSDAQLSANVVLLTGSPTFTGTVTSARFAGNAAGLTNVSMGIGAVTNANIASSGVTGDKIADGTISNQDLSAQTLSNTFWRLTGNAGTTPGTHFIGTTDNQPVEVKVNGTRAFRIELNASGAPNLIGGAPVNAVGAGVFGATIGGGGATNYAGNPYTNRVDDDFGTIGGGMGNSIQSNAYGATIGGGWEISIQTNAYLSTIGGGYGNTIQANASRSTIGGGSVNSIHSNADFSAIGGGNGNSIQNNADSATIGGGWQNTIQFDAASAMIGGGYLNAIGINSDYAVIGGGHDNQISSNCTYAAIFSGSMNNVLFNSPYSLIAAGFSSWIDDSAYAAIGGGYNVSIDKHSDYSIVGGGYQNRIGSNSAYVAIGGGSINAVGDNCDNSVIAGGGDNVIGDDSSTAVVGGGWLNQITSDSSGATIAGGMWGIISNKSPCAVIGGGSQCKIGTNSQAATIGGGWFNSISSNAQVSTIGGGYGNDIGAQSKYSVIGGGYDNNIGSNSDDAVIGGGYYNEIGSNSDYSVISGGYYNEIGDGALYAFAAGRRAHANHEGSFVWGDSQNSDIASSTSNQVTFRAWGGYRIYTASGVGVQVAAGGNAWSAMSDRNVKENFATVNPETVLEKVAALPVTTWNMKTQDPSIRHLGPMAQDFRAAFGLGEDERYISTSDADGVALAAIQGLYRQLQEEKARNDALEKRMKELEARIQ